MSLSMAYKSGTKYAHLHSCDYGTLQYDFHCYNTRGRTVSRLLTACDPLRTCFSEQMRRYNVISTQVALPRSRYMILAYFPTCRRLVIVARATLHRFFLSSGHSIAIDGATDAEVVSSPHSDSSQEGFVGTVEFSS